MATYTDSVLEILNKWVKGEISREETNRQLNTLPICSHCGRQLAQPIMIEDEPYCPSCARTMFP